MTNKYSIEKTRKITILKLPDEITDLGMIIDKNQQVDNSKREFFNG